MSKSRYPIATPPSFACGRATGHQLAAALMSFTVGYSNSSGTINLTRITSSRILPGFPGPSFSRTSSAALWADPFSLTVLFSS